MAAIMATGPALSEIAEGRIEGDAGGVIVSCHLCGRQKGGLGVGPAWALWLLTRHYDRRHRGWTS